MSSSSRRFSRAAFLLSAVVLGAWPSTPAALPFGWLFKAGSRAAAREAAELGARRAATSVAERALLRGAEDAVVRELEEAALRDAAKVSLPGAESAAVRDAETIAARDAAKVAMDAFFPRVREHGRAATEYAVVRAFSDLQPRVRWVSLVPEDVKTFVASLERGFRDPERYLRGGAVNRELLARWNATPVHDRVFIAGSSEDVQLILGLKAELERQGKAVFFFTFCAGAPRKLCESEAVGAFQATAGRSVLVDTAAARRSRYVTHEIAAAARLRAGERPVFLVTGSEVSAAVLAAGGGASLMVETRILLAAVPGGDGGSRGTPPASAGATRGR